MAKPLLTFELSKDGEELHVHGNPEGLRFLADSIEKLGTQAKAGKRDHDHLMTEAWAGTELSGNRLGTDTRLINKVTLHAWPDEK